MTLDTKTAGKFTSAKLESLGPNFTDIMKEAFTKDLFDFGPKINQEISKAVKDISNVEVGSAVTHKALTSVKKDTSAIGK